MSVWGCPDKAEPQLPAFDSILVPKKAYLSPVNIARYVYEGSQICNKKQNLHIPTLALIIPQP